jgi:RHS repeat-associated protein
MSENFRTVTFENITVAGVDNAIKVCVTDVLNATTRYFAFHYRDAAKQWDYLSGSANGTDWMRRMIVTRGTATASERTERVRVVEQAMGQTGIPDPASDDTVSDLERTYELFGTAWRVIRESIDPGGDALVSEWSYWLNGETTGPASSAGVGRLKWHGRHDGYEEHWNYAENWQFVSRTWRSAMLAETVETSWNPATNTSTVTTTRNSYNAGLVTRAYDFANRTVTESRTIDSTLTTSNVTTYRATGADFGGRIDKIVHFDDTLTTYDYDRTGGVMTLTTETGAGTNSVTEGEQTEMKYNALGEIEESKVTAIGTGAGTVLQHMEVTDTDALGRPTEKSYFPDGSGGSAYTQTMSYLCCGIGTETDRYGVPTSHTYDLLGRRTTSTSLGVTTETVHDGLTTRQHRYPALGSASDTNEISRTVRNVSDTAIDRYAPSPQTGALVLMEEERTTWLNPLGIANSLGNTGGRKVVRTRIQVADDGAAIPSQTTWYNRDGTFYETTGNVETARREHWAQNNGRLYHYLYHKNASGTSYLVTIAGYDNLGSVSYVYDKMRFTTHVKNTKNQVIRSYGDGGTGNVIVDNYEYDAKGDRGVTSRSLSSATSINYGADQITATVTYPAMRGSSPVIRTETRVWQPGDSTSYSGGGGTVASYSDRTPDGLQSWNELFPTTTVATEHGGNGSNQGYGLTHAITTLSGGGTWTVFETRADGTKFKQFHVGGRLDYTALEDDTGATIEATYYRNTVSGAVGSGYDSFGRVVHATDLHRGKTTTAFVSDTSDHVASVTDPGSRVTAYAYDHRGRMKSETKDAGAGKINAETTFTHYIDGLLKEQDGDLTYRVSYTYDFAGRKQTMTTYGTVTATTTWIYSYSFQGYGNLLTKTDHDGNGAVYTYDRGGRLKTRRWDRGNWTRYVYDAAGRLIARLYFTAATAESTVLSATAGNDPHTPDAHFVHDRLGRTTEALTIATYSEGILLHPGTRRFSDHHPDTLALEHEIVQVDPDIAGPGSLGTVAPSFERHLYKRQDSIMRGTGHYIHTAATSTPTSGFEGKSLYAYDATGQIGTVTGHLAGGDKSFGYGRRYSTNSWRYGDASGQKSAKVFEVILPVTGTRRSLYYEKTRDVFAAVVNYGPSSQISVFYHNNVNALGQRINSQQYGSWFSVPFPNSATRPYYRNYDYNDTGEVVSHDVLNSSSVQITGQLRGYDYDGIGNREAAIEGDTDPTQPGAVSYTPNVLNQYTDIGGTLSPVYDTDGNLEQGPLPVNPTQLNDLEWDGENRLRKVDVAGGASVLYTYDAYGRRTVSYTGTTRTYTLWDDWNPQSEYTGGNHTSGTPTAITRRHTWLWGLDLTETLGGAGGVGGLLADQIHTGTHAGVYYPLYDGNGNVAHYLSSTGALAAHFEYDPFGKLAVAPYESAAGLAAELRFQFSTKYEEPVTGLYYYLYRYYDPVTGRWPSRDPIGERGGINLYGFIRNRAGNRIDVLGLDEDDSCLITVTIGHRLDSSGVGLEDQHQEDSDFHDGGGSGVCAYIGCGANRLNSQAVEGGWGVPNMLPNNYFPQNVPPGVPGNYPVPGDREGDYTFDDDTDWPDNDGDGDSDLNTTEEQIDAFADTVSKNCRECCDTMTIYYNCLPGHGVNHPKCNTIETVQCQK